jgi:hypothetical protein
LCCETAEERRLGRLDGIGKVIKIGPKIFVTVSEAALLSSERASPQLERFAQTSL